VPLDDLIQRWATFAHATTSAIGLSAALAAETAARHVAIAAVAPAALPDSMLRDLDEARQCWLEALAHLHRLPNGAPDEEGTQLVPALGAQSLRHSQCLLALAARLCQQIVDSSGVPAPLRQQRIFLGPLSLAGELALETEEVQRW
jgi:hypothetical protein